MASCRTCGMDLTGKAQCWECQRQGLRLHSEKIAELEGQLRQVVADKDGAIDRATELEEKIARMKHRKPKDWGDPWP